MFGAKRGLKTAGTIFVISIASLLVGLSFNTQNAFAAETVPDWIKVIAGAWADGTISTDEFLNAINFLISSDIIKVPGYVSSDSINCSEVCPSTSGQSMTQTSETMCNDSMDNDGDGYTDCDDFDCQGACSKELMCTDGKDNDNDGFTDCDDFDCDSACSEETYCPAVYDPVCGEDGVTYGNSCEANRDGVEIAHPGKCVSIETMCADSVDNDGDGYTDCDDFDCQGACSKELMCTDGQDNDGDGFTDCDDFDCSAQCS